MSEPTKDGRRKAEDGKTAGLDGAIDRAVREMLDVEPPSGLRGRVVERIESPRHGIGWVWIVAPMAAAMLMITIVLPRMGDREVPPSTAVAMDQHRPTVDIAAPAPAPERPAGAAVVHTVTRPARAQQRITAAAMSADAEFPGDPVEPLAGPAALVLDQLEGPPAPVVLTLQVAPIQVRPLEVNAIPDTPRERREE
jgi:hypothetical protein